MHFTHQKRRHESEIGLTEKHKCDDKKEPLYRAEGG